MIHNFSYIKPVPQANDLIDIALSKTCRGTPSEVHPSYQISRIRSFYVRKVKHAAEQFETRLSDIIREFPVIEDIHPFYSDLMGILYDRDHYKIALGRINTVKHKVDSICKEYCRLINFGDSLYRCKELKRAALGRMATVIKKLSDSTKYLEEVRQHLSRLPTIDTSARTILICGYPNVGKSSFMNKISNAHVDVQSYAFTTKSIFVGHFDYSDLKWQVLDTPGIFDQPLETRNSIEMQTITALAHLRTAVLFFIDPSESCGFSLVDQIALYENLTPLLSSQVLIVLSKCDLNTLTSIDNQTNTVVVDNQGALDSRLGEFLKNKQWMLVSAEKDINVELARNTICDMLLRERIEDKLSRVRDFTHRIIPHVPRKINEKTEEPHLGMNPIYGLQETEAYFCEHKNDIIPEILNGKNISDFINPSIVDKLSPIEETEKNFVEKRFDILDRETRELYEACNNARISACLKNAFNKRSTIPSGWTRKIDESGAIIQPISQPVEIVKVEKPIFNKKVVRNYAPTKNYLDLKPKHLYRTVSRKHGKKLR